MSITNLKTWKIFNTEFDLEWVDSLDEFDAKNNHLSYIDLIFSKIKIFSGGRKESSLLSSLMRESMKIIINELCIKKILEIDESDREVVFKLLGDGFASIISDNELILMKDTWRIFDADFKLIWCQYWEELNKDSLLYGLTDDKRSTIHIYKDSRSNTQLWQTLWHECMHVIIWKLPIFVLDELRDTVDQETIIDQVTVMFNRMLQDNNFYKLDTWNNKK